MPDAGGTLNAATFTEVDGHAMPTRQSQCARVGRSAMRSSTRGWKCLDAGTDRRSAADCHLAWLTRHPQRGLASQFITRTRTARLTPKPFSEPRALLSRV